MVFNLLKGLLQVNRTPIFAMHSNNMSSEKLHESHKVNNLERRFLVWTGKYKSLKEVPDLVGQSVMERARNRMRIKIANYMIVGTLVACAAMVYLGKQDAKKGESVTKQNLEWHKKFNEDAEKKK